MNWLNDTARFIFAVCDTLDRLGNHQQADKLSQQTSDALDSRDFSGMRALHDHALQIMLDIDNAALRQANQYDRDCYYVPNDFHH